MNTHMVDAKSYFIATNARKAGASKIMSKFPRHEHHISPSFIAMNTYKAGAYKS